MDVISKWSPGNSYGPVLSQTDLYLLNPTLDIHPILQGKHVKFTLLFNLSNGHTAGFNPEARDRDVVFAQKDEPATLPRVQVLYILTEISPWCTTVKNDKGVTMRNICDALWKDYSEHNVTDAEFEMLPARLKEQVRRTGQARANPQWQGMYTPGSAPAAGATAFKRYDWLRDRCFFESMRRDDHYAEARLGFKAANVFILTLTA
ncbi:hypothetical protein CPB85DRAFT_1299718 [Mucidula mucida]|nr:hypothetical protein CPB85DRAFT_1299718 [Mucidula mucida]